MPMLLRIVPRLQRAFSRVVIKLRCDAGFAIPLLYDFCEFFGIRYALAFRLAALMYMVRHLCHRLGEIAIRGGRTKQDIRQISSGHIIRFKACSNRISSVCDKPDF
ncbi:MAG TPA: hypothetical protein VKR82_07275, partial [Candidatus Acidoferrales bacterium]|nr:hypothetical protein [Candidatus Acidoferrales bacterium]